MFMVSTKPGSRGRLVERFVRERPFLGVICSCTTPSRSPKPAAANADSKRAAATTSRSRRLLLREVSASRLMACWKSRMMALRGSSFVVVPPSPPGFPVSAAPSRGLSQGVGRPGAGSAECRRNTAPVRAPGKCWAPFRCGAPNPDTGGGGCSGVGGAGSSAGTVGPSGGPPWRRGGTTDPTGVTGPGGEAEAATLGLASAMRTVAAAAASCEGASDGIPAVLRLSMGGPCVAVTSGFAENSRVTAGTPVWAGGAYEITGTPCGGRSGAGETP